MTQYYVTSVGTKSIEFFSEPNSSPHEVRGAKQLQILQLPPLVCEFLNEAAVDSRY